MRSVGEKPQDLACLGAYPHLAHAPAHRVTPAVRLTRRQQPGAIGEDRTARFDEAFAHLAQRRIGFEAGHDPTARGIEFGPPAVIVITQVEHIRRTRRDRHDPGGTDVVDISGVITAWIGLSASGS